MNIEGCKEYHSLEISIQKMLEVIDECCLDLQENEKGAIKENINKIRKTDSKLLYHLLLGLENKDNDKDEGKLTLQLQLKPEIYKSEYESLQKIIQESFIDDSALLVGLYMVINFKHILVTMIDVKLNPVKPKKHSPFVYVME